MDKDVRSMTTIESGNQAEVAAEKMLTAAGLVIIARNYRCKSGEIDIVAREKQILVFVEVRQRSHRGFGSGFESVNYRKQAKLVRTARFFLVERKLFDQYPCRFDIVSVRTLTDMQWIKDAFQSH